MKSLFFLAKQYLEQWERDGLSKQSIDDVLAENAALADAICSAELPSTYRNSVHHYHTVLRGRHAEKSERIYPAFDWLELPDRNIAGEPMPEAADLAEKKMRWAAKTLIQHVYNPAITDGETFPFRSTMETLNTLHKLCIPDDKMAWDMRISDCKRTGYQRSFTSSAEADRVETLFNTILFPGYGMSTDVRLQKSDGATRTLEAGELAHTPFTDVLHVEEFGAHIQAGRSRA